MNKILLSLLVPILALACWAAMLEKHVISGKVVRLKITGYDPRDLLSGHYIRYSLDLGEIKPCNYGDNSEVCICLAPDPDGIHDIPLSSHACREVSKICPVFLKGQCSSGRFNAGVERYSIPEGLAPVLAVLPGKSSAKVALNKSGEGRVLNVYVENELLEEYAQRKLSEATPVTTP